jgi:uncharacterized protein involved in type VI secretion and phage assembly
MDRIAGVATGLVKSLDDPEQLGRVQLEFPWMSEESPESYWARIAAPMAGGERGFQLMPELGDEVLVAFDHGDLRLPYIVGFLWNGEHKPPRSKPEQRALVSVAGHVLEFDDTPGSEKVSLLFKGELPGITLDQNGITIKFSDSCFIELKASELKIVNSTLVSINP